jgi:hypothetical protein
MRAPRRQPIDKTPYLASDTTIRVAVCGDPIVGRALVLLLQGPRYDVRFVPTSSLSELGALKGAQLVLLTPTWELNSESRDAFLATLRVEPGAADMPILKLSSSGGSRNGEARVGSEHIVPWPCSTEELERRIQAILFGTAGRMDSLARPVASGKEGDQLSPEIPVEDVAGSGA